MATQTRVLRESVTHPAPTSSSVSRMSSSPTPPQGLLRMGPMPRTVAHSRPSAVVSRFLPRTGRHACILCMTPCSYIWCCCCCWRNMHGAAAAQQGAGGPGLPGVQRHVARWW